jgi:hypothetical protein
MNWFGRRDRLGYWLVRFVVATLAVVLCWNLFNLPFGVFTLLFLAGLILGVVSMLAGSGDNS